MGRFRTLKNSLLGGQISRAALGRTDLPQYAHACEVLQNMIPILSGGAYRRPGTIFMDYIPAKITTPTTGSPNFQSSPPRLFPFIASDKVAYVIAISTDRGSARSGFPHLGGGVLRYFRATDNKNGLATPASYGFGTLPYRCKSRFVAPTTTDQSVYTRMGGPGAIANTGVNTVPTAVLDVADSLQTYDDDVWAIQFCQSNDVMFLTHPDYAPQTVYLIATDNLDVTVYDFGLSGLKLGQSRPYLNQNSTAATMTLAWVGAIVPGTTAGTMTCSTAFFDPLHSRRTGCTDGLAGNDGAFFAIKSSTVGTGAGGGIMFVEVTDLISSTVANVIFHTAPASMGTGYSTTSWWESAWSNYRGWPSACAIYQQRLCFASTKHQPNALWFTATNVFGASVSNIADSVACKFTALGDGPSAGIVAGATGKLADGRDYSTPQDWVYYPVDDSQGDGQSTGPLGTQPFRISLATTSLDAIQYLSPDQQLFIGTATQEWICAAVNGAFDVANSECTIQSHYGSDNVQAIRIGYELMFVLQNKQEVRAYQYNYFDQSFFGEPVQLFFDEYPQDEESAITTVNNFAGRKKIRQMDWDASRSTLWCVDTAGSFFGLTRDRKLSITAWHTHQLGGYNASHGAGQNITDNLTGQNYYTDSANYLCDGSVVSICSVPNPKSGIRDVWMVVKRSYQGGANTIWSIERMVGGQTVRKSAYSAVAPGDAQEPCMVDCAYFLTDTLNPLAYSYTVGLQLAGQSLIGTYYSSTWGLFAIAAQAVVSVLGAIDLQTNLPPDYGTATPHTMVMGLAYNSIVQPVRPDPQSAIGTSQGAIKRASKLYARVFKTLMFKAGPPPPTDGTPTIPLELAHFDPSPVSMAKSPEIFTGDKEVFINNTYTRDGYVYLLQDQPLPFTLISLSIEGTEYEQ